MNGDAAMQMSGMLETKLIKGPRQHKARSIHIPKLGRIIFTDDPGESTLMGREHFQTNLQAQHFGGDGRLKQEYDLGSGLVTNIGVLAMANDPFWSTGLNLATLATQNFHAVGTGVTAASANDFRMQTLAAPTTTTAVTGTQSIVAPVTFVGPTSPIYRSVATVAFTTTQAITEWGLHSQAALSSGTGTPFTATSATSFTATGTPFTASAAGVRGLQQSVVLPGTTAALGLIASNTTSVGTLVASATPAGWYTQTTQAASATPGGTEAFTVIPVMWDHKVFAAINVVNTDTIQFTYSLSLVSGG